MIYRIALDLARWAMFRLLGRLVEPIVGVYMKDLKRFALGLVLAFFGAIGAIVAGLVVAAAAAIPGVIAVVIGLVVMAWALRSATRHAVVHGRQAAQVGAQVITSFRRHGHRSLPEKLLEPRRPEDL